MRCVQTYEEKCDYNQYDQSKHNCVKHPIFAIKNVTETECQICRHIWETEMVDALKWLVHYSALHWKKVCSKNISCSGHVTQCMMKVAKLTIHKNVPTKRNVHIHVQMRIVQLIHTKQNIVRELNTAVGSLTRHAHLWKEMSVPWRNI